MIELMELTKQYGQLVIPNEDDDVALTHWWVIRDGGPKCSTSACAFNIALLLHPKNGSADRREAREKLGFHTRTRSHDRRAEAYLDSASSMAAKRNK